MASALKLFALDAPLILGMFLKGKILLPKTPDTAQILYLLSLYLKNIIKKITQKNEIIVFGIGCFWCSEAVFFRLKGVIEVTPGYAGGKTKNPTYEQVSSGETGHAEVVKIKYNPNVIGFEKLLEVFFSVHDPTTLNRQGSDIGEQYRSTILYAAESQRKAAEQFIKKLTNEKVFDQPIVTEIKPLDKFYKAESYHMRYCEKNTDKSYCQQVISPKLLNLKEKFAKILKR